MQCSSACRDVMGGAAVLATRYRWVTIQQFAERGRGRIQKALAPKSFVTSNRSPKTRDLPAPASPNAPCTAAWI